MRAFIPAEFEGRPLEELQRFLRGAPADLVWLEGVEWRDQERPRGRGVWMDEPVEAPTVILTRPRTEADLPPSHPPITVPNVDIEQYLGGGQFGCVYSGRVKATGLIIAIKVIPNDAGRDALKGTGRVIQEAMIGAKLSHRNIVRVFDLQPTGDYWIILMELVQGRPLQDSPPVGNAVKGCLGALADALCEMGDRRIVHRDIKPANIVVRRLDHSPVIVDLGLAIDLTISSPPADGIAGTLYFMPPEAMRGEISLGFDAYSLGVTAFSILAPSGRLSFPDGMHGLIAAKVSGAFVDRVSNAMADTEPIMRDWILRTLNPDVQIRLAALHEARTWPSN
jgi:serine/threonine protein kinase